VIVGRKSKHDHHVIHWGYLVPQSGLSEREPAVDRDQDQLCAEILDPLIICADEATEEICLRSGDLSTAYQPVYRLSSLEASGALEAKMNGVARRTFEERLDWDISARRIQQTAGNEVDAVDAEWVAIGTDALTIEWRGRIHSRRSGRIVIDPDCAAVDLMCAWQLRFDRKGIDLASLRFLDGEGHGGELYNREVYVLTPQEFRVLFRGDRDTRAFRDWVPNGDWGRRTAVTRSEGRIPRQAALNPPLAGAGLSLLEKQFTEHESGRSLPTEFALLERGRDSKNREWGFAEL
jgi:hypothetical protein